MRMVRRSHASTRAPPLLPILLLSTSFATLAPADIALLPGSEPPTLAKVKRDSYSGACSEEGQWNCMANSWQRCGAGQWSEEMPCAEGTHCTPSGLTTNLQVQDDDDDGGSSGSSTSTASSAAALGTTTGSGTGIWRINWRFMAWGGAVGLWLTVR
ncbi:uncharacterized protein BCR38DRAFT_428957 [Pseudomassariella vexata]|uniref:Uncharacterized protein n=1 Tax=Pseudomassariella vexata TaxID=1141098 RepID=A0A1Y2E390_9PEZI|nr:uncharacterized protein BCR38DRAFT_428957 [Pseudomassariella vexata]ORY65992.1 hypothetical protein BCR38DRAFT_428957 [Pseudomassariella vexata]